MTSPRNSSPLIAALYACAAMSVTVNDRGLPPIVRRSDRVDAPEPMYPGRRPKKGKRRRGRKNNVQAQGRRR